MEIRPILSSLLRNRAGAVLVAVQIALTLAIVVNAVYVTKQRVDKIGRPSGMDDQNIFWVAATAFEKDYDFKAMVRDDLAMLRALPNVVNATPMNQIPLSGSGSSSQFFSQPNEKGEKTPANLFPVDEHGLDTLGATLTAGKTFAPTDVEHREWNDPHSPPTAIVSQAFVTALFGKEPGLGKTFYSSLSQPYKIIGVIGHMHGSWVGWDQVDHVILQPMIRPGSVRYAVRAEPGHIDAVMGAVDSALRKRDANRVIGTMKKMSDGKKRSYSADTLMAVTLTIVTGLVLVFSALGIFGLATFNVNTRTRQIGTRRAIGARKRDIVRYFMTENWLVTSLGVVVGCCLALAVGYWLSTHYALPRLDLYYLVGGVLGLWIVGQLAAWQPSLKAAKVSPAMATRNV
jgi:putative ABC transport system permease protein